MSAQLRPCRRCGAPKSPGTGRHLCDDCRNTAPRLVCCRYCGDPLPNQRRVCDACKLANRRASIREWAQAHPEAKRAARTRYNRAHPERAAESRRRWLARVKADPKAYARLLENKRMDGRLRAERDGRPVAPVPEDRYPQANRHWRTPAAPVLAEVDAFLAVTELPEHELATLAGVSQRLLYRLRHEHQEMVTVATADRILTALGSHLDLLEAA